MKIIILLMSIFSLGCLAADLTMIPVTNNSPNLVKDYASGICSVGINSAGTKCCTGFRIGKNLIMTNFHCLACAHELFFALLKFTPPFMEPTHFLYSIPQTPHYTEVVKEKLRVESGLQVDERFFIPHNNKQFKQLMNSYQELLTRINFKNTIDNLDSLEMSQYKISEILALNLELDYAVLRVENLKDEKILQLNSQTLVKNQKLAIMGHPSVGPYPNKKVYDASADCKILNPFYENIDVRAHVFTHYCSTAPGSSGSPIVDRLNGKVIGIHWGANEEKDFRYGIEMKSIMKDLSEKWQMRLLL